MASQDDGKILAEWVGPFGYTLIDGTVLGPNVVVSIGEHEAADSDNWKPLSKKAAAAAAASAIDPSEGDE